MVAVVLTSGVVVAATLAQAANGPIMSAARPGLTASRLQIPSQPTTADEQLARQLAEQINAQRAAYGLAPYQFDLAMAAVAAAHSADQAARQARCRTPARTDPTPANA